MEGGVVDVLLIEDNPDDVDLTLRAGRETSLDKRIFVARDGEEALRLLRIEPFSLFAKDDDPRVAPDLVILDWSLPRVHGAGVIDAIRSDDRFRRTPVVVFSGSQDPADSAAAYEKGASSYISKPEDFRGYVQFFVNLESFWFPDLAAKSAPPAPEPPKTEGLPKRERGASDPYANWRKRLEDKRKAKVGVEEEAVVEDVSYWKTEFLFAEPGVDPDLVTVDGIRWNLTYLYESLGLEEGATPSEIQSAYRQVAKAHHPDMHPDADDETRTFHMDKMRAASASYRALRTHIGF